MTQVQDRFRLHLRRNLLALGADITLFVWASSFSTWSTILPLYVHHLTSSNLVLGLLPAIRNLGFYLPPILVSPVVVGLLRYKPFVLFWTVYERVPYLALAAATLLLWPAHPTALLWLFFLMVATWSIAGGITTPAWLQMVSLMIPVRTRGRFFGVAGGLGNMLGVGGAALTALILERVAFPHNFALCFAITFAGMACSFAALALCEEPPEPHAVRRAGPTIVTYLRSLPAFLRRERNFAWFLLSSVLINVGVAISPFLAAAASRQVHASDTQVGVYSGVLLAVTTLGSLGWGWLGDHAGYRLVLLLGGVAGILCMLLATIGLHTSGIVLYYLAFIWLGAYSSALQLAAFTVVAEFSGEAERPTFIALSTLVLAPVALGAPIAGGVIADGHGYEAIFVVTTVALALALGLLLLVVRDPRSEGKGS